MKTISVKDHLVTTNIYDDETLRLTGTMVMAQEGWRLNGHRDDCRCETCRPDIVRLSL